MKPDCLDTTELILAHRPIIDDKVCVCGAVTHIAEYTLCDSCLRKYFDAYMSGKCKDSEHLKYTAQYCCSKAYTILVEIQNKFKDVPNIVNIIQAYETDVLSLIRGILAKKIAPEKVISGILNILSNLSVFSLGKIVCNCMKCAYNKVCVLSETTTDEVHVVKTWKTH